MMAAFQRYRRQRPDSLNLRRVAARGAVLGRLWCLILLCPFAWAALSYAQAGGDGKSEELTHPSATADEPSDDRKPLVRGGRYCELIVVKRKGLRGEAQVWGTQGVSECPEECQDAFDTKAIQSETGARRVVVNGPRIWLPNTPAPTPPQSARRHFGGVEMGLIATLEVKRGQSNDPYEERVVPRKSSFTFNRGEEIFELISPEGAVYVMHSMSQTVDPRLEIDQLASLEERLKLPQGWRYQVRTLDTDLTVDADDKAVVLQDRFKNTFHRVR